MSVANARPNRTRRRRLSRRQWLAAAVLAILAASFITLDLAGGGLRGAHGGVRGAMGALYRGTDGVLGPARRFLQGVPDAAGNRATIAELRTENARLQARLTAQAADAESIRKLSALQLTADATRSRILPARVIAFGPSGGFDWTVTLDAGSASGVRVGQTVTDGGALVGRVLHAGSASCVVLLAADPGSGVGVRDVRNGELAVATGQGMRGFTVSPLSAISSLQVGDLLETGPAGASTFVPGLAVGAISSVHTGADGATIARLDPAVSPTALDLVGVILTRAAPRGPRAPLVPSADPGGAR